MIIFEILEPVEVIGTASLVMSEDGRKIYQQGQRILPSRVQASEEMSELWKKELEAGKIRIIEEATKANIPTEKPPMELEPETDFEE